LAGFQAAAVLLDITTNAVLATLTATVQADAVSGGLIYVDALPTDTAIINEGTYYLVVQISNPVTKYVREFNAIDILVTKNRIPSPFAV